MCDDDSISSTFATFFLREHKKKASKRNGHSAHAHLQVDQIFPKRLSGHYCHSFSNLPQPIMQLSGVVNWSRPPLKCVKTQAPSTTRAIFSDVRAAEDIKQLFFQSGAAAASCPARQMFRRFHPPADKQSQLQICLTLLSTKAQKLHIIQQIMID